MLCLVMTDIKSMKSLLLLKPEKVANNVKHGPTLDESKSLSIIVSISPYKCAPKFNFEINNTEKRIESFIVIYLMIFNLD